MRCIRSGDSAALLSSASTAASVCIIGLGSSFEKHQSPIGRFQLAGCSTVTEPVLRPRLVHSPRNLQRMPSMPGGEANEPRAIEQR
jgi:hypothetical protein